METPETAWINFFLEWSKKNGTWDGICDESKVRHMNRAIQMRLDEDRMFLGFQAGCAAQNKIVADKGPWSVEQSEELKVFIENIGFQHEHDVRLYVDGDFVSLDAKLTYATGIAAFLNLNKLDKNVS